MPFAAIEITKLVGGWISHCFDECDCIYTSFFLFLHYRTNLGICQRLRLDSNQRLTA